MKKTGPSLSPTSKTGTMFGWSSPAAASASQEAAPQIRGQQGFGPGDLDGDLAPKPRVERQINDAIAAAP